MGLRGGSIGTVNLAIVAVLPVLSAISIALTVIVFVLARAERRARARGDAGEGFVDLSPGPHGLRATLQALRARIANSRRARFALAVITAAMILGTSAYLGEFRF
jgi:hypothetical protein